jgi:hypothetical protein
LLNIPLTHTGQDSSRAAKLMSAAGAGHHHPGRRRHQPAVAKGCGYVPLVPISTGTNNVFPVMVEGTLAGLAAAVVALRVDRDSRRVIVLSVIDNLTRGAAGQAVHNFNLMVGFPETMGLDLVPFIP